MFELTGLRALVTGASSGFGKHFAGVLARHGAELVLAARRVDRLEEVRDELLTLGGRAEVVPIDLSDPESVRSAAPALVGTDVLVNNAGVTREGSFLDQSEDDWDAVLNTNVKGMFLLSQIAGRAMRDHGRGGSIINVASILGLRQAGGVASYAVSKSAVVQLTKVAALELARFDIRVNALAPGYFATDLNGEFWDGERGQALIRRIPQRRLGQLDDLDGPLLLLASAASRYMTGSVVEVDGGHLVNTL